MSTSRVVLAAAMLVAGFSTQVSAAEPAQTVVLVHGAWADGSSWAKIIPLLADAGLKVVAVQNPLSGMANDVAVTRRVIDAQPGQVILVGHSLGGAIITEAGEDPKVAALVYVAAFAPPQGLSVNDLFKDQPSPPWAASLVADSAGYVTLPDETVAKYFAQDLTPAEIKVLAATQGPTFAGMLDDKMTVAAYTSKPSWYIVALHDGMIPPAAEQAMAKAIKAKVTELDSSHVAMLSRPNEVAAVIIDAAKAVR
jgi:pimeloyl-ACP methyl ester carboxylesterase